MPPGSNEDGPPPYDVFLKYLIYLPSFAADGLQEAIETCAPRTAVEIFLNESMVTGLDDDLFVAAHLALESHARGQWDQLPGRARNGDRAAWDACAFLLLAFQDRPAALPQDFNSLAYEAMLGLAQRPTKRGRRTDFVRDLIIADAVGLATSAGATATRNQESPPTSACDIVSQTLEKHGIYRSYAAIEKIWKQRKDLPA